MKLSKKYQIGQSKIIIKPSAWEKEYEERRLVSMDTAPQADVLRFFKWLKKDRQFDFRDKLIFDLGSGNGRNANYLAAKGAKVVGLEMARNALAEAKAEALRQGLSVEYNHQSMAEKWPAAAASVDLVLDITSSNALSGRERRSYLAELSRTMKSGSFLFVRTLRKEGDKNAKMLLRDFPGPEENSYLLKGTGIVEYVFSEDNLHDIYGRYFSFAWLEKKSGYQRWGSQSYKRNYWLAYLVKK